LRPVDNPAKLSPSRFNNPRKTTPRANAGGSGASQVAVAQSLREVPDRPGPQAIRREPMPIANECLSAPPSKAQSRPTEPRPDPTRSFDLLDAPPHPPPIALEPVAPRPLGVLEGHTRLGHNSRSTICGTCGRSLFGAGRKLLGSRSAACASSGDAATARRRSWPAPDCCSPPTAGPPPTNARAWLYTDLLAAVAHHGGQAAASRRTGGDLQNPSCAIHAAAPFTPTPPDTPPQPLTSSAALAGRCTTPHAGCTPGRERPAT